MLANKKVKYIKAKGVIFEEVDGQVHILDEKKDAIVTLNSTATFIWKKLKTPKAAAELTDMLVSAYNVSKGVAQKDTLQILTKLVKMKLAERVK